VTFLRQSVLTRVIW